jgi:hypothetical protein
MKDLFSSCSHVVWQESVGLVLEEYITSMLSVEDRQYIPKYWYPPIRLHGVLTEKTTKGFFVWFIL